ncbi:thioredoxin domain-containing protein [Actinotalea sp. C106]|uniref:DsbA family protein n=1 Tax=Actinotalea sp. C106 TaxID=2908644 RepID=UPI0020295A01|nr:thioredoxin domain-containing protein [Actinotalea sp. C106]
MSTQSKQQRREDARAQAVRRRQEQERAASRQRVLLISLVLVGLVVIGGVVVWILSNQPDPAPDFSDVEDPLGSVSVPANTTAEGGVLVGADGVAGSTEGSAEDAVTVTVYSDFLCPVCADFEQTNGPVLEELRATGDVVVDYRPVSILDRAAAGSQYATRSATAVALVADQDPEAFVAFHDVLFANQPTEGGTGLSDEEMADLARGAGVDDAVADQIADGSYFSWGEDSYASWVAAATEQATREFEQFGTPTVLVDGENLSDLGVDWRVPGALELTVEEARG